MIKGLLSLAAVGLLACTISAQSALVPLNIGNFPGGLTVIDYGPTQTFAPVDGETIDGVLHNFSIAGNPSTDAVIDAGPGDTNNITIANIEGNANGVLSLLFPSLQTHIGYGFALNFDGIVDFATTIEVFDAADISLGSLSFIGEPDPLFAGGFAGLESTIPFLRAEVSWREGDLRFAFDNLRFEAASLPEPATVALLGIALIGLGFSRRRRS